MAPKKPPAKPLEANTSEAILPPGGRKGFARIGLLTITDEEFPIVRDKFGLTFNLPYTNYYIHPSEQGKSYFTFVHSQVADQTNTSSQKAADDMIEDFRPELLCLIGTAGGRNDKGKLNLGDVVIAKYLHYCGYWKYTAGKILIRHLAHDHPSYYLLTRIAKPICMNPDWDPNISVKRPEAGKPKFIDAEIVSGNNLYGDPKSEEQQRILDTFDKARAFEMEGFGVSRALYEARLVSQYNPLFMIIRGISDYVDKTEAENQKDRETWTAYAVEAAASFAHELVKRYLESRELSFPEVAK